MADGVATALYLREATALGHLTISKAPPDVLVSNSSQYADEARALGYKSWLIPSIVDRSTCRVSSTRERVLLVNPIASHGVELAIELARLRPDVPFTLQESWPLSRRAWLRLRQDVAPLDNVRLSRSINSSALIYAEARVLLAPHRITNRPRVVAEAQANGIPVLASRLPGLIEAVGPGGLLVDISEPPTVWAEALSRLWDEPTLYEHYSAAAAAHAYRSDMDPESVVTTFEEAISAAVSERPRQAIRPTPAT
jgi:glycosyltransferase involved in cell wall biosynthesis